MVKAEALVGDGPVPAGGQIGVESGRLIALAPSQGCQGGHALLHIQLIGHRVRRLEESGEAGEVLKLHTGRAAAGDRGVHPALDGVLGHGVAEGSGVLLQLQPLKNGQVREGLVHDGDDVHRPGDGAVRLYRLVLLRQLQHPVPAVILRLVHRAVPHGHREVQQEAVGLGDPLLGVDAQGGQHPGAEEGEAVTRAEQDQQGSGQPGHPVPPPLGRAGPDQEEVGHQQNGRLDDVVVQRVVEVAGHVGRGPPARHIRREQDAPPEAQDIVVEQPHQEAQGDRHRRRSPPPPQDQPAQGEQQVIPDHVHQHLPGRQILEHIVLIQDLHHPEGRPRPQQEHQTGDPPVRVPPHASERTQQGIFAEKRSHVYPPKTADQICRIFIG